MRIILSLKKTAVRLSLFLPLFVCISCGDDEGDPTNPGPDPDPVDTVEISAVSQINVEDVSNAGDASDIQVRFQGPANQENTKSFRVLVLKDGKGIGLNLEGANSIVSANSYEVNKNSGRDYFFNFPAGQVDTDGDVIVENTPYQILVLSLADESLATTNALSTPSDELTLTRQVEVTTLVSSFLANDALSVDTDGNIYGSNFGDWSSTGGSGSKLLKVTPDGTVSEHASGLSGPLGNVIDGEGNIFVVDDNNGSSGKIVKISPDKTKTTMAEIPGWPAGLAMDNDNNVYITNYQSSTLHKLSADGELSVLAQDTKLNGAVGVVFDGSSFLYAANYNNGKILKVDLSGNVTEIVQLDVVANFGIGYITMLGDHLYATSIGTHEIYKVWVDGTFEVLAGTGEAGQTNGFVPNAGFFNPNGIAADPENNVLYVSDWGRPGLRKIQL